MEELIQERITRAKELPGIVRHAAIATVNEDGSPHNTPVFATFDDQFNAYWSSSPDALHSQNIARTGQVFIVLFDSTGQGGGLFMRCTASLLEGDAIVRGLAAINAKRAAIGRPAIEQSMFQADSPQRLYEAVPAQLWVNYAERDSAGRVLRDIRHEITVAELVR
ncbi:MAG TPA: pyridoxamine 5'-phosphate oxidase family protein [Candidatus Saccharimonadales bacterium]|nr:pyridoxamine 5'-phosphate oxidase family protein [Candidatus Saccharimonadales bacterium]